MKPMNVLKTYIISHHSQTNPKSSKVNPSLRPILFHIILKPTMSIACRPICLRPILFHIILKRAPLSVNGANSLRPILFHIILKHMKS